MKKAIFLSILPFLLVGNAFSTMIEDSENFSRAGLHYRGKNSQEEYFSLIVEETQKPTKLSVPSSFIIDKDEDIIFSPLGDIWRNFQSKNFTACFNHVAVQRNPTVPGELFLMGFILEKGLRRGSVSLRQAISYYVQSLASVEENHPLYSLALEALERCKEEALKQAKMPFSY